MSSRHGRLGLVAAFAGGPVEARPARNAVFKVEVTVYCDVGETASGAYTRRGICRGGILRRCSLGTRIRVQGLGQPFDGPTTSRTPAAKSKGASSRYLHARLRPEPRSSAANRRG